MRTAKILAGLLGGTAALVLAALLAVWMLANPNAYKSRVAAAVKESTGRDLALAGDIKLSVFPRVALELGPASLGNPPGFGDEPFLTFRHATVRVKLWPLLHDQLALDGVAIDGLDLRLRRNADGEGNWGNPAHPKVASALFNSTGVGDIGHSLGDLAGIRVTQGRISYQDVVIDQLQLEFGAVTADGVVPVTTAFDADLGTPHAHASVNGKFALSPESSARQLRVAAISLSGLANRPGGNQPTHWEISAPVIDVNPADQSVQAPAFALRYLGAQVHGNLKGRKIGDDWDVAGSVTVAPLLLREFLPRLGITVPRIQDPRALSELTASCDFTYDAAGTHFSKIQAHLDDTQIHGSVAILNGDPRSVRFDLAADSIDADRYLEPPGEPPADQARVPPVAPSGESAAKVTEAAKTGGTMNVSGAAKSDRAAKSVEADGTLSVASLHAAHLDFTSVKLTIDSKDHVVHLFPAQALLDGGRYSGDITYDRSGDIPSLSLDEHLAEVDMRRLFGDTAGGNRLSGRGNVSIEARAQGRGTQAMLASLNGHLEASLADGAFEGVDLDFEFGVAQALLGRAPKSKGDDTRRTTFDTFRLSADIANGVATTKDLTLSSQALRVTGQGSTNLSTKAVDFQLLASLSTAPDSIVDIPLRITGTYSDPTVRPDLAKLVKGELKQRLQEVLHDKLPGLFGKP
jgi:AsmA protein